MRHQRGGAPNSLTGVGSHNKTFQTGNEYHIPGTDSSSFDSWIRRLGQELILAYQGGDRETACRCQSSMFMAIRLRSPAQQHRRSMEIDAAIGK